LEKMRTWKVVEAPPNVNIIKSGYVLRYKGDASGQIVRYKARLVAKGYSQVQGIDYFDTYSPIVKLPTLRALLAWGAQRDAEIHQMDVKSAYLHAELPPGEVLYMELPPRYKTEEREARAKSGQRELVRRLFLTAIGWINPRLGFIHTWHSTIP
jgi:hypothetical protein